MMELRRCSAAVSHIYALYFREHRSFTMIEGRDDEHMEFDITKRRFATCIKVP